MSVLYLKGAQINPRQLFATQLVLFAIVPVALAESLAKSAIFVCTGLRKLHICCS
jgi:hypothetical protein